VVQRFRRAAEVRRVDEGRAVGVDGQVDLGRLGELAGGCLVPALVTRRWRHASQAGKDADQPLGQVDLAELRDLLAELPLAFLGPGDQELRPIDTRDALGDEYRALHRKLGLTTVMITHDMTEAILLADRVAVMRTGRLLALGSPAELSGSNDPYVGELMRTPRRQAERLAMLLPKDGAA